jgi:hypothetical protein
LVGDYRFWKAVDTNDENVPGDATISYVRARRFVVGSWVSRVAGLAVFPFAFWPGLALVFFAVRLDAAFVPPRPEPAPMSGRVSFTFWGAILIWAAGWVGRMFAPDVLWANVALWSGFVGIVAVEGTRYLRVDLEFLKAIRESEIAADSEAPPPSQEQLPLL